MGRDSPSQKIHHRKWWWRRKSEAGGGLKVKHPDADYNIVSERDLRDAARLLDNGAVTNTVTIGAGQESR
jgi:hypothetical protein